MSNPEKIIDWQTVKSDIQKVRLKLFLLPELYNQLKFRSGFDSDLISATVEEALASFLVNADESEASDDQNRQIYTYEDYDKLIELNPNDYKAWYGRGVVLKNLGSYEEAIANLDKALEIKPDYYKAWYARGNALYGLDFYEEAITSYDKAIEFKPDYAEAWYYRNKALKQLGCDEEANVSYKQAIKDPDTGGYSLRADLPGDNLNEVDVEQQEMLDFLHEQLSLALTSAIEQEIRDRITALTKSKNYGYFAQQFIPGLQLYYCQNLSLKDIAPKLGMTSWEQARRIFNPGDLLSKVRTLTVQQILDNVLKKAVEKGLTKIPPEPDYLKTLAEYIEAFADDEIFQQAAEEIRAGKSRSMDSAYAQQLRKYLDPQTHDKHIHPQEQKSIA
jgi:tetratricopeptide (TPR) repeat protein